MLSTAWRMESAWILSTRKPLPHLSLVPGSSKMIRRPRPVAGTWEVGRRVAFLLHPAAPAPHHGFGPGELGVAVCAAGRWGAAEGGGVECDCPSALAPLTSVGLSSNSCLVISMVGHGHSNLDFRPRPSATPDAFGSRHPNLGCGFCGTGDMQAARQGERGTPAAGPFWCIAAGVSFAATPGSWDQRGVNNYTVPSTPPLLGCRAELADGAQGGNSKFNFFSR